jgi:hypothetical protein
MIGIFSKSFFLTAMAIVTMLGLTACHSEHLHPNYGKKTQAIFAKQRVFPRAAQSNPSGLDSEEAALIHTSYRKNMGGTGAAESKESSSRILIVPESKK